MYIGGACSQVANNNGCRSTLAFFAMNQYRSAPERVQQAVRRTKSSTQHTLAQVLFQSNLQFHQNVASSVRKKQITQICARRSCTNVNGCADCITERQSFVLDYSFVGCGIGVVAGVVGVVSSSQSTCLKKIGNGFGHIQNRTNVASVRAMVRRHKALRKKIGTIKANRHFLQRQRCRHINYSQLVFLQSRQCHNEKNCLRGAPR